MADALRDAADVFAPLPDGAGWSHGQDTGHDRSDGTVPMLPAPLPLPDRIKHSRHGTPSQVWRYLDAAGALLFAVCRFDAADGSKEVLPYTATALAWRWKAAPRPRPLYGLDRLAARPGAPVLVVEGEKAADAAAEFFPGHVTVAWPGGSNAAGLADWGALAGRTVAVWGDADAAGAKAAAAVVKALAAVPGVVASVVRIPADWPAGWDVADLGDADKLQPEGVTSEVLRAMLAAAEVVAAAGTDSRAQHAGADDGIEWPDRFAMRRDGLFYIPPAKRDPKTDEEVEGKPMWLSAPFRVLGEARDTAGHGRALVLCWRDSDGREQRYAMSRRLLHGDHGALAGELEERGLRVKTGPHYRARLAEALAELRTTARIASADRTGWHVAAGRTAYVMADGTTFGAGGEAVILTGAGDGATARVATAGTLEGWRQGVAAVAVGNDRLAMFLAAAFAPPLLELLGVEGGGLHLLGGSSTGKSTCLEAAASAWGSPRPGQQVRSWRTTANALEGAAVECSDGLLALDEIGLCDGKDVAAALYMLTGGAGKGRADRNGGLRTSKAWRTLFLSTGEVSPADKIAESGQRSRAGQDVRCANIPADAGAGRGVWQVLHGAGSGEALSNAVKAAALAHHGHAIRAFLEALATARTKQLAVLLRTLTDEVARFTRGAHVPGDADGQVRRVAQRFGLIAAAGEMATGQGVLPWPAGEATRAAVAGFSAWLAGRGGHGAGEAETALAVVRGFIGTHGASRFSKLFPTSRQDPEDGEEEDSTRPVANRAGWRRQVGDRGWEYLILPGTWNEEVCRGLDPQQVARAVAAAGFLGEADGKHLAARVSIPNEGRPRLFVILPGLLSDDDR